jgi:hypothetical protein
MIKSALRKLLLAMLKDEYPEIKDIYISSRDMGHTILYGVGIGLEYGNIPETKEEEIRLKTRVNELSKYILDNTGKIETIFFYDPT